MEMMLIWGFIIVLVVACCVLAHKISELNELDRRITTHDRDIHHLWNLFEELKQDDEMMMNEIFDIKERIKDIEAKMSVITDERTSPYYDN